MSDFKNVLYVDRIYACLQTLERRNSDPTSNRTNLSTSELRLFSQNGEDGVIDAILRVIGDCEKYFIEFGVGDGWSCNTRLLAEIFGWSGLYIEVDDEEYAALKERHCNSSKILCNKEAVTPENVNELFEAAQVPKQFGVLSIDIDGQDYWVWKALDDAYQPEIVVIEFNSALDPALPLVEEKGLPPGLPLTATWGASLLAITALAREKGYTLVHIEMAGVNAFFVREKTIEDKGLTLQGVIENRSPNFGLRGRNHPDSTLYGNSEKTDRPQIKIDLS
jgi:hypothetical protein